MKSQCCFVHISLMSKDTECFSPIDHSYFFGKVPIHFNCPVFDCAIYETLTANITVDGEKWKVFPPKSS